MKAKIEKCGKLVDRVKPLSFNSSITGEKRKYKGTIELNFIDEKIIARFNKELDGNARIALLKEIFYKFGIKYADRHSYEIVTFNLIDENNTKEYQSKSVIEELINSNTKFNPDNKKERIVSAIANAYKMITEKIKLNSEKIELPTFISLGGYEARRYSKILDDYLESKNIKGRLTEGYVETNYMLNGGMYPYYIKQFVFYPERKYDINN